MLSAVCGSARLYSALGEEKGAARTELAMRKNVARRDVDNMSSGRGGQAGKDAETKEEPSSRKVGSEMGWYNRSSPERSHLCGYTSRIKHFSLSLLILDR